jgi:tetratricopeptide (TPR) repeat protein
LPAEEMQKKYERTEALLKRQLEENPKNIFALANLVRNYLNKKEYDTVVEWGERGLAIPVVKTDISSQNQKQRISIDLAQAFLKTNRFDEAEKVSKEALKTHPDFLDNLFQLGNILVGKRAFQEALHYYKKFLHAKENECHRKNFNQLIVDTYEYEHKAYNNIGECYKNVGMLRDAEIAYKKAVELYNRDPIYYANLIDLYILQNRLVEAEELAKSAIRVNIADTWIYSLLGKIFELQNKTDDAVNAFRQAVQKDNKNISVSINLVQLLLQFNRLKEAEEVLKRILMYFPDHVGLMCLMEKLRCKNGDRSNVLRFIQDVLKSKPSDNNVYLGLADLCIEIKDYRMAIEALGRFLENSPNDAKVIANIATCYVKLGNFDSAIMGFQAALAIDPACDLAAKNLSVLKKNYCLQV